LRTTYTKKETNEAWNVAVLCGQYRQRSKLLTDEKSLHFADNTDKEENYWRINIAAFCGQYAQRRKLLADVKSLHFADNIGKEENYLRAEISLHFAYNIGKGYRYSPISQGLHGRILASRWRNHALYILGRKTLDSLHCSLNTWSANDHWWQPLFR